MCFQTGVIKLSRNAMRSGCVVLSCCKADASQVQCMVMAFSCTADVSEVQCMITTFCRKADLSEVQCMTNDHDLLLQG